MSRDWRGRCRCHSPSPARVAALPELARSPTDCIALASLPPTFWTLPLLTRPSASGWSESLPARISTGENSAPWQGTPQNARNARISQISPPFTWSVGPRSRSKIETAAGLRWIEVERAPMTLRQAKAMHRAGHLLRALRREGDATYVVVKLRRSALAARRWLILPGLARA